MATTRRTFLAAGALMRPAFGDSGVLNMEVVRRDATAFCEAMLDAGGPYGCYRGGPGQRPDLYSSCDIAILRAVMGEDLRSTVPAERRAQWIAHINSFADKSDGSYFDTHGHSKLHANGMVISALGALGGRQLSPVRLYNDFNTASNVVPWLEKVDWVRQWSGSHLFWGGLVCFSCSRHCPAGWLERVFGWLDANLDERTGWWRKGIPHADRHQPLGGSVHILPIYEHHRRRFPYPERVIDSVIALQLENGRWLQTADPHIMRYLELDALYALNVMRLWAPDYRVKDVARVVERYGRAVQDYYRQKSAELYRILHPHQVLAAVSTFGLLARMAPAMFPGGAGWSDIFSDKRFYDTRAVEG